MRQVFRNCSQWQSVLVRSNTTVNTGKIKEMFTAKFQFPVLFGLPVVVLSTEGGVWAGETMAAKELGALWQWTQCMQMAQWPSLRDSVALSFSAGPNFMPKVVVRWSSVRSGNEEPSMRCSRKFCNRQDVILWVQWHYNLGYFQLNGQVMGKNIHIYSLNYVKNYGIFTDSLVINDILTTAVVITWMRWAHDCESWVGRNLEWGGYEQFLKKLSWNLLAETGKLQKPQSRCLVRCICLNTKSIELLLHQPTWFQSKTVYGDGLFTGLFANI